MVERYRESQGAQTADADGLGAVPSAAAPQPSAAAPLVEELAAPHEHEHARRALSPLP